MWPVRELLCYFIFLLWLGNFEATGKKTVMLRTSEFNCSCHLCNSIYRYVWLQNWTMVVGCTLITGLEFDMFSTSIAKILGGTLWSAWLFLHFFCFLSVCSFLMLFVVAADVVKLNVLSTLVQNPSFKQTCLPLIYRLECLLTWSSYK